MQPLALRRRIVDVLSGITDFAEREADIILYETAHLTKGDVFLSDRTLEDSVVASVETVLEQRRTRMPLQYILKKAYFRNLELFVSEGVLIPRPETELLAERVLEDVARRKAAHGVGQNAERVKILDIGTGSGAIAAALASEAGEDVFIHAVDISEAALKIAGENLNVFPNVKLYRSDLFGSVCDTFDIICSNPPYIAQNERAQLAPEVLKEPEIALFGGEDGLDCYRRMMNDVLSYANPGASLILEIGASQYDDVAALVKETLGRSDAEPGYDYAGRRRLICVKNLK